jgi:hypothetical protein
VLERQLLLRLHYAHDDKAAMQKINGITNRSSKPFSGLRIADCNVTFHASSPAASKLSCPAFDRQYTVVEFPKSGKDANLHFALLDA